MTTLDERPAAGGAEATAPAQTEVSFDTSPDQYKHWTLSVDGEVATLTLDVAEDGGIVPGYELKMNSYDLGVDIELHDAVQRVRFEHPEAKALVVTSAKDRMFCAGANIKMLAASPHSWKVNFCKFTNETRNGIEDASAHSGLPLDRRGQRHRGRRRLRAGAGLRRDRADRRQLLGGLAARGPAARRAARHRRPDPRRRQARRPARPRRRLLHHLRGHPRRARRASGGWSTASPRPASSPRRSPAARPRPPRRRPAPAPARRACSSPR